MSGWLWPNSSQFYLHPFTNAKRIEILETISSDATAVNGFNAFRTLARVTSQSYATPFLETLSRAGGTTSLPNMMIDVKNKLMPCDTYGNPKLSGDSPKLATQP